MYIYFYFKPGQNCYWTGKLWKLFSFFFLIVCCCSSAVQKLNTVVFFQSAAKFLLSAPSPRQEDEFILWFYWRQLHGIIFAMSLKWPLRISHCLWELSLKVQAGPGEVHPVRLISRHQKWTLSTALSSSWKQCAQLACCGDSQVCWQRIAAIRWAPPLPGVEHNSATSTSTALQLCYKELFDSTNPLEDAIRCWDCAANRSGWKKHLHHDNCLPGSSWVTDLLHAAFASA